MTPENKIRREMLLQYKDSGEVEDSDLAVLLQTDLSSDELVDEAYDLFIQQNDHWDIKSEFREGQVETNIPADYSRHYEAKSVAAKMSDGSWVGWTYWYGGGKHGDPESIDWICDAYDLTCVEEEKLIVVQTFTKIEND